MNNKSTTVLEKDSIKSSPVLWKPSIVLVERCETGECLGIKGVRFQMIPWFLEDPKFAEAWSHYQPLAGAPKHFELYVRTH